jgi:hypothetical protein
MHARAWRISSKRNRHVASSIATMSFYFERAGFHDRPLSASLSDERVKRVLTAAVMSRHSDAARAGLSTR